MSVRSRLIDIPLAPVRAAVVLVAIVLALGGCAARGPRSLGEVEAARGAAPSFDFARDTFAFPNLIRARHPGIEDLYANYCFVLARGIRQFLQFARFDPGLPKVDHAEYVDRVRRVAALPPWEPLPASDDRIVIPGYASLRDFSRGEEAAVKEGLGGRFWTWVHWTNWRVTFPVTRTHQEHVAAKIVSELRERRLVQLLITNWPKPELNHTVVAYGYRATTEGLELIVWDPNNPAEPGVITFDRVASRFVATRVYDTEPGLIRVFRMYYSLLL